MLRRIILIDKDACNGCGLCVDACHEGAIGLVDGKALLLRDDYCDGLGDCLPVCPTGALSFEEREAMPYDEEAVQANMAAKQSGFGQGCPGGRARALPPEDSAKAAESVGGLFSKLRQWPVQLRLAPVRAPYFDGAHLLVAADCAAYAYGNFHKDFMEGKVTLIACPKLDDADYAGKLEDILRANDISAVTVVRMSVPCCKGLEQAVAAAVVRCGKAVPLACVVIEPEGGVRKPEGPLDAAVRVRDLFDDRP